MDDEISENVAKEIREFTVNILGLGGPYNSWQKIAWVSSITKKQKYKRWKSSLQEWLQ